MRRDNQKKAPILETAFAHLEGLVARLFDAIGEPAAWRSGHSRRMLTEAERSALIDEAREAAHDFAALVPLIAAVEFLATASCGTL